MSERVHADWRCQVFVDGGQFRAVVTGSRSGRSGEATGWWPAATIVVWFALLRAFFKATTASPQSRMERLEALWRQNLTPAHRTAAFFHPGYKPDPAECCDSCRAHMAFGLLPTAEVEARHAE